MQMFENFHLQIEHYFLVFLLDYCPQPVRIDNSSSLETQAKEQGSNPEPGFLWASGPVNRGTACLRFSGIEPPQADTKRIDPCTTNQEQTQERGTGLWPGPMTSTPEQDNQAAKLRFLTNGRTPRPGAILPPLDPSTQFPWPWPSQCLDGPPMENVKFGGGYYIDPRTPRSKLITIFE
ncbi:hypothetical protein DSO57_1030543 [Entomophthora muscae]|uniref:Uncharacterized protein n=1 Tax=Entomophthora muscae TaxID=34485 RepID=A0ACC2T140_9FUNG|nr:hypothetical protein DSO57_1030543 [Entomophthora muscae]